MLTYRLKRLVKDIIGRDAEGRMSRQAWLSVAGLAQPSAVPAVPGLIVSLTTIPSRLERLHVTIESILNQTIKPERVVLWLNDRQHARLGALPVPLRNQLRRGFEIRTCPTDWPHQKLLPSLQTWPNATIITADDDIIYPPDWIEDLYRVHREHPGLVVCRRGRLMKLDGDRRLTKYDFWPLYAEELVRPSHAIFPTGVCGALYPPRVLHPDVHDTVKAAELCPRADDIWFKVMAFRNGTKCIATSTGTKDLPEIQGSQVVALKNTNVAEGRNDVQMEAVMAHYGVTPEMFFAA